MKGIISKIIRIAHKRKKPVQVVKRFLKSKYNINASLKVLNQRIKNTCK